MIRLLVVAVVCAGVCATSTSAHLLTRGDAESEAYLKIAAKRNTSNIDVDRCWRKNRHRVNCTVSYDNSTRDPFSDYCLDYPSSCEESCTATVSVRYKYPTSYYVSSRVIGRDCY